MEGEYSLLQSPALQGLDALLIFSLQNAGFISVVGGFSFLSGGIIGLSQRLFSGALRSIRTPDIWFITCVRPPAGHFLNTRYCSSS